MQTWTCVFILFCSVPTVCQGCDWLRHQYQYRSNESLTLVDTMGGEYTEEDMPVSFPFSQYRRIYQAEYEDRVWFLSEAIRHITELLDGNTAAVTWDQTKLEHLLVVLHRQFDNLKACVSPGRKPDKSLKRYFNKLKRRVLRKMAYNAQAWELIRKETKDHLVMLDILAAQTKRP